MPFFMVELAKPFALFLWQRQHGSHHTCSVNFTVFTSVIHWLVPFNISSMQWPVSPNWSHCLCSGSVSWCTSKGKFWSQTTHWNNLLFSGKRTKLGHHHVYIQTSNTVMGALWSWQFEMKWCVKLNFFYSDVICEVTNVIIRKTSASRTFFWRWVSPFIFHNVFPSSAGNFNFYHS